MIAPVKFGEIIRIQANSPECAADCAVRLDRKFRDESPGVMVKTGAFPDMPNDIFLFVGKHWRDVMAPLNENRGAFYRTMLGRDDLVPAPDDLHEEFNEGADLQAALYNRAREIAEKAMTKKPDDPDALINLDMRFDDAETRTAIVFNGGKKPADIGRAQKAAYRLSGYMSQGETGTAHTFTPEHRLADTFVFAGPIHERVDILKKANKTRLSAQAIFDWFVESLADMGLLEKIDVREQGS